MKSEIGAELSMRARLKFVEGELQKAYAEKQKLVDGYLVAVMAYSALRLAVKNAARTFMTETEIEAVYADASKPDDLTFVAAISSRLDLVPKPTDVVKQLEVVR